MSCLPLDGTPWEDASWVVVLWTVADQQTTGLSKPDVIESWWTEPRYGGSASNRCGDPPVGVWGTRGWIIHKSSSHSVAELCL
jgi:hypothetical protein